MLCQVFHDICVIVVITSNIGEFATLDGDFSSLNRGTGRHGAAVVGLLAVIAGHQRCRIGCESGRSIMHGRNFLRP